MTKVISFITQKGGPGKTTMTILSATYLNSLGANVAVIDADFPQHSFSRTRGKDLLDQTDNPPKKNERQGEEKQQRIKVYPVIDTSIEQASVAIKSLKTSNQLDFIFIDVPGTMNINGMDSVVRELDLIIVPAELEYKNITAALESMSILRKMNPSSPMGLLWTQIKRNHKIAERHAYEDYFRQKHDCFVFDYMLMDTVRVSQLLNTITPQPTVIDGFIGELGKILQENESTTVKQ